MRILYVTSFALLLQQAQVLAQTTGNDTLSNKKELQEVVVSGIKATDKNPVTFTNLNRKDIERQNFGQDLPFLLNLTPSTVISSDAGGGVGYTGIRIRGTDPARTNVTINGVPINDAESHGMFWVNMPDFASSSQNIQVQRGVGTSTNGAGAFGASINVQTDGLNPIAYGEVSNGFGSFNTRKHTVKAGTGLLDNKWAFDVRLSKITSDGFIDRGSSDLKSFFVSAAHYGEKSLLKFNVFSGVERTYQAWNGIPEARLNGDVQGMNDLAMNLGMSQADQDHMLASGSRTYNQFTYANQVDNYQQDYYQLFYTYLFSKHIKANVGVHYTYGRGYYEEFRKDEEFTTYKLQDSIMVDGSAVKSGDIVRRRWLDNDFYGTVFSFVYDKDKLNITVGGGLNRYDGRHFGELIWTQYALGSSINDHFYDGKSTKTDFSLYGKVNYQLTTKLVGFLDLQARNISYTLKGEDLNSGVYLPYDFNLSYTFFNPKAGLTYDIGADANVYGYVGVANKEPVRNDIIQSSSTSVPKPEQLINYELGYRKSWKKTAVSANFYYMDYKDQLVVTGEVNDVGAYNRANVASSYRAGIELTGGVQLLEKLRWQATLTYSQNKIKAFTEYLDDWDNGGQLTIAHSNTNIAFSPDWIGSSMFSYTVLQGLNVDLISKYVGKQYLDNTQNENRKLDAFFVNDIRAGYEFKVNKVFSAVRLGVQVNNVLNVAYEPNGYTFGGSMGGTRYDFNYYYPQAGTNVLTNLTLKF
ncbi:MAG: TonB-dependent receptor [Bacteroidota bacterium]